MTLAVAVALAACSSPSTESPTPATSTDAATAAAGTEVAPATTARTSPASTGEGARSETAPTLVAPATTEATDLEDVRSEIDSAGADLPDWIPFVRETVDMVPLTDGRIHRLEWSPRGDRLAMSGWDIERGWGTFVIDADGTRLMEVDGYFRLVMSWSPDGSKILHLAEQRLVKYGQYNRVRPVVGPSVSDMDTLERFHLDESGGSNTGFNWSPDSTKVQYFQVPFGLLADRFAVWTVNADGTQRQLIDTFPLKHNSPPGAVWWSPDSSEFMFVVNTREDHQELWRARAEASHASFLANGRSITAGYSPDSSRIWANVKNYDGTVNFLLFDSLFVPDEVPYLGISWKGLASVSTPTWSRAGSRMSFLTTSPDGTSDLFVDYPGDPWGESFASGEDIWAEESPDGSQIAYTVTTSSGGYELRVANADRSDVRRIVSGTDIAMRWSPDGSKIWYSTVSADTGVELGIALVDGSATLPLRGADEPDTTWSARWSPDGSRISYTNDANGDSFPEQLWTAEADGSQPRLIADVSGRQDESGERIQGITARWSEDSTHLWYLLHASGWHANTDTAFPGVELWAVPVADGEPRLVAAGEYIAWHWSPDARYVAFELIEQNIPFSGGVWIAASNNPP